MNKKRVRKPSPPNVPSVTKTERATFPTVSDGDCQLDFHCAVAVWLHGLAEMSEEITSFLTFEASEHGCISRCYVQKSAKAHRGMIFLLNSRVSAIRFSIQLPNTKSPHGDYPFKSDVVGYFIDAVTEIESRLAEAPCQTSSLSKSSSSSEEPPSVEELMHWHDVTEAGDGRDSIKESASLSSAPPLTALLAEYIYSTIEQLMRWTGLNSSVNEDGLDSTGKSQRSKRLTLSLPSSTPFAPEFCFEEIAYDCTLKDITIRRPRSSATISSMSQVAETKASFVLQAPLSSVVVGNLDPSQDVLKRVLQLCYLFGEVVSFTCYKDVGQGFGFHHAKVSYRKACQAFAAQVALDGKWIIEQFHPLEVEVLQDAKIKAITMELLRRDKMLFQP